MFGNMNRQASRGFTLLEILVVTVVLLGLIALLFPMLRKVDTRAKEAKAANHFRQFGVAITSFAMDNDGNLPLRLDSGALWPTALVGYLDGDTNIYAEPNSAITFRTLNADPLSNTENHTSYILNSFRDLGDRARKMVNIEKPASTILMAAQEYNPGFFMDIDRNDYLRFVKYRQYREGAYYLFGDGSARYVASNDYDGTLWMADKSFVLQQ